ncbi:GSCOCT00010567001.2-RA-CDS [Cotesia congregata]|uniref:Carboxylic ester hydrolase n=1 Tax=Cotesia congregata TaxID=51543 RepID=A0A8J2H1I0_COTCN|nr:GSCOCT00010567001.2-RA-CDS [Cotesia congregata]CAG5073753.1 carboxylesterase clade A member 5 [Cotesia congregata]
MKLILKLEYCVISGIILTFTSFAAENEPIIKVHSGQLRGIKENNFFAFRGIPYAAPPIGQLRFRDPKPVEPWSGVRDATKFGNSCTQFDRYSKKVLGSENCLFLNVYTTNLTPQEPRAVMFWIHSSAFAIWSGNDDKFGPDYLVQKDVILVTINYRLDIFGFLNLDDESVPGNQGLKDTMMALKWVQQNIGKFGGNPNSVTIFGQSSGSAMVHYLTLSPLTQGLFNKAILQSSVASNPRSYVSYPMKDAAEQVSGIMGRSNEDLIVFLQNADPSDLLKAIQSLEFREEGYLINFPFVPSVDSKSKFPFLSILIIEAVKAGIRVPHLIGYTSKEAIRFKSGSYSQLYCVVIPDLTDEDYKEIAANPEKLLLHPNGKKFLEARNISVSDMKTFFYGDKEISRANAQQYIDLVSADFYWVNIHHVLEIQLSASKIPSYLYKFDYYSKESAVVQKMLNTDLEGTAHTEENFYLFNATILKKLGIDQPCKFPVEKVIQKQFLDLWTTFAKTGNPNLAVELGTVHWEPVDDPIEFKCLEISKDLKLIKEKNLLYQLKTQENVKT